MICMQCNSNRILSANAHCSDLGSFEIYGQDHNGYVPDDLGIGGGDDVCIELCLECGQVQGHWPLPISKLENKTAKRERVYSDLAQSVIEHIINTNDGDTSTVLALMLQGWLTKSENELVHQVADCVNALLDNGCTRAMGESVANALEYWEHWDKLEPLLDYEYEDDD